MSKDRYGLIKRAYDCITWSSPMDFSRDGNQLFGLVCLGRAHRNSTVGESRLIALLHLPDHLNVLARPAVSARRFLRLR